MGVSPVRSTRGDLPKGPLDGPRLVVLCYHQFGTRKEPGEATYRIDPDEFRRQLDWLKDNGWTAVTLDQVAAHWEKGGSLPSKSVLLTFDDGFRSIYTKGWPVIEKAGVPGVLFLYTDFVKWQGAALKYDELAALRKKRLRLQSHSMTHPNFGQWKDRMKGGEYEAAVRAEMEGSRDFLKAKFDEDPQAVAYPYGVYNAEVLAAARDAGYRLGFTVDPGPNDRTLNAYRLKRNLVSAGTSRAKFEEMFNKRVLHLADQSPLPGAWLKGRSVTVTARILDDVDPKTVVLKLGDVPLKDVKYDPVTRTITRKAKMPIFRGGHLLTAQAVDKAGVLRVQSWYFRVRKSKADVPAAPEKPGAMKPASEVAR